jgi:hypothetical protein
VVLKQKSSVGESLDDMWIEIIFPCKTEINYPVDTKISIWEKVIKQRKTNTKLF